MVEIIEIGLDPIYLGFDPSDPVSKLVDLDLNSNEFDFKLVNLDFEPIHLAV